MVASLYFCLPNETIKVNINSRDELHDKYRRKQIIKKEKTNKTKRKTHPAITVV